MNRRELLQSFSILSSLGYSDFALSEDFKFSREKYGYPKYPSWYGNGFWVQDINSVSNFSGGYEKIFPFNIVKKSDSGKEIQKNQITDLEYSTNLNLSEYLFKKPVTSILLVKNNILIYEKYGFDRNETMRLFSWSMAKSITGILLGICIDKGIIDSYDDEVQKYLPQLSKSYHGTITLRNLSNMSSGADVWHEKDNDIIYPSGFLDRNSDISRLVSTWNKTKEEQGLDFNYNELCPLTIGMVIRAVTKKSLCNFAYENIWSKIGATSDATWLTDSKKAEFNSMGFGATARDWCKLGMILTNRGKINNNQILSEKWIEEITSWNNNEKKYLTQGIYSKSKGNINAWKKDKGYKCFLWHYREDGTLPCFVGHGGQRLFMDLKTNTILLQTALDNSIEYDSHLINIIESAGKLSSI